MTRTIPPEQTGFCTGFSMMHDLHTVNQLLEEMQEFNIGLYITLIDYNKASQISTPGL